MEHLGVFNLQNNYKPEELYGIGDIHGDFSILEHVLVDLTKVALYEQNYSIVQPNDCKKVILKWNPVKKNVWLVFCGDLVDMKRSDNNILSDDCDFQILETLFRLKEEAEKYDSKILILLGNHEIMNFQGNYDYVPDHAVTIERQEKFKIGSDFAKKIAKLTFLAVRINNIIFVHGGFCIEFLKELHDTCGFDKIINKKKEIIPQLNIITKKYLSGYYSPKKQKKVESYIFGGNSYKEDNEYDSDYEDDEDDKKYISIGNSKGPLWCRTHSANIGNNDITCETELDEISRLLNIKNYTPNSIIFVISHTPQFYMNNGINSSCNKRIWRIDLGMSRAFEEQKIITGSKEQNNIIEKLDVSELDKNRAMSILKMNKNININEYDPSSFTKISEGVLSRDYVRNQQATLRENLALTEMFVTHNTNNKYMLKKALPPLTNIIKKYQKLKKEVSKLNKY